MVHFAEFPSFRQAIAEDGFYEEVSDWRVVCRGVLYRALLCCGVVWCGVVWCLVWCAGCVRPVGIILLLLQLPLLNFCPSLSRQRTT
jgi:hypothetical protein